MRVDVFGRSYAQAWEKTRKVVVVGCVGAGWIAGDGLMGSGDAMGELRALDAGVDVVGEMSTHHSRAPEGSCTPWRMALPSLSQMRS